MGRALGKDIIHLTDGSTIQAEINGRSLDGTEGFAWQPPPGPRQEYLSWGEWLQAGQPIHVQLVHGQWKEKEEGVL